MYRRSIRTLIALAILAAWTAEAMPSEPLKTAKVPFQVDTAASRVYIKVTSATRLGHDHGVVGQLSSGSGALGGAGELVFDMRTFTSDQPEARSYVGLTGPISRSDAEKTTTTMLGDDVLAVRQFPTAKYTFRSATPMDGQAAGAPGKYMLDGVFALHGVEQAIQITATLLAGDRPGVYRMRCAFAIRQTWFGMKPYTALGGLVGVNDPLEIWGELVLRPDAAATAIAPTAAPGR